MIADQRGPVGNVPFYAQAQRDTFFKLSCHEKAKPGLPRSNVRIGGARRRLPFEDISEAWKITEQTHDFFYI